VRGRGLLVRVELENAELAEDVVNRMRDAGVLINRTGPPGNLLKIRPPLVFKSEHVEMLVGALAAARRAARSERLNTARMLSWLGPRLSFNRLGSPLQVVLTTVNVDMFLGELWRVS
jgi:hypothetical protein